MTPRKSSSRAGRVLLAPLALAGMLVLAARAQDFESVRGGAEDVVAEPVAADTAATGFGQVVYREGRLDRQPGEAADWLDAPRGSAVEQGDLVRTGPASRAELQLGEGNRLRLAPESRLSVRRLGEESAEAGAVADLELEEGDLWAELDGLDASDSFTIRSGLMGAAITGTVLRVAVGPEAGTLVRVYRGEVRVGSSDGMLAGGRPTPIEDAAPKGPPRRVSGPTPVAGPHPVSLDEWLVIVKSMQEIRIAADGRIQAAGGFSADDADEARDWVRWNRERDRKNGAGR